MDDREIVALYWARSETAIAETGRKYGSYCRSIARGLLPREEDCEECVNDTYLRAWETIPPRRPDTLSTYLGKITRNLALDRCRYGGREKRGGGQAPLVLEEIGDCVPGPDSAEALLDRVALADCFDRFLASLPREKRDIFVRRYWFFSSIEEIARDFAVSESRVKMILLRARGQLKDALEREGLWI